MKNIELKTIWKDGMNKDASKIQIQGTSVRLNKSASLNQLYMFTKPLLSLLMT